MGYKTIRDEAIEQFEEKKSIFIGYAKRVSTEEEAKQFVSMIKSKHKDARHNVYAYIVGSNSLTQRYSDDGEPQGTGGIPVLEVIKRNEVSDTVVVVTRYFGGILLGSAGLCRAYSKGAALAIKAAGVVEKVEGCELNFTIEYDLLGKIQYLFNQNEWHIENIDYTDKVNISVFCEDIMTEKIISSMTEVTSNKFEVQKSNEELYFKEENRLYKIN